MEKKNIYELLSKRYPESEYSLMAEVSDASGFHRSRSADFISVGLWPSRGLPINGIELKSSRSDWLSEFKKPEKAESIFQYCDFFWLLTTDETIAKIEEIPLTWGWMSIKGGKIITKKEAPKLTPVPLTKHFVCAMLKRACSKINFVHVDSISQKIEEAKEEGKRYNKYKFEQLTNELADLRRLFSDFEQSSGIQIGRWDNPVKIGEAVKFIKSGGTESIVKELVGLEKTAQFTLNKIQASLKELADVKIYKTVII